jgi:two-component system, sensor histidine kinase and response regulator
MGIDKKAIVNLRKLGGSKLVNEILALFLEHAPKKIEGITQGAFLQDWKAVEKNAHSLKSSAANLGAMEMHRLCESLEHHAINQEVDSIPELITKLQDDFIHVREHLQAITANEDLPK